MNDMEMVKILERFIQKDLPEEGQVKVTSVPDYKSVFIEQTGNDGRSVMLKEYVVGGKNYRAGYSPQSDTVYISRANRD